MPNTRSAWRLFLLFQCLYALTSSGNAFRLPDEYSVYYQVEHLVDAGDLSVPQTLSKDLFFGKIGVDGKPYAPWGPLTAFLALPAHLAGRGVAAIAGISRAAHPDAWTFVVSGVTMLSTSTAAAATVTGFYVAAIEVGAAAETAWLLSLMLGGASVLWPYGTSLYSEAWQAAAFIWAVVFLVRRQAAAAGALLALGGLTKFTSLIFTPAFVVAALADRDTPWAMRLRAALALGLGIGAAMAVHLWWNDARFGNAFDFGYNWNETVPQLPARAFALADLPRGVFILLFTPGKSIVLWAPVLWFALARGRRAPRLVQVLALTSLALGLVVFGSYLYPDGGYSHGPRQLVPILPLLLLPAAVPGPPLRRRAVVVCSAIGFTMAILAVSISYLQDQSMGRDLSRMVYYERVVPPPGRAWNRYRLSYVPFVGTLTSHEWPIGQVGHGIDIFPFHLARARATIPDARVIPVWLPWALPAFWLAVLGVAEGSRRRGPARVTQSR